LEVHTTQENEAKMAQISLLKENDDKSYRWLVADFPHMTFAQMHERLRVELLRRIQRGTLSISLLSRQTGFGKSHLSNFLHSRRQLSLEALDRMLAAQHMAAEDLLQLGMRPSPLLEKEDLTSVPVVSHSTALFEPYIRPGAIQMMLHLPPKALDSLKSRAVASRRSWQRFVAVRISSSAALPMEPLLFPDALAVIDRHYNSLIPYYANRPNLYAVRDGEHLSLRYVDFMATRLVLRPVSIAFPIDLIEIGPEASPGEYIAGRVAMTFNKI
jgi:hypothetical protein